jgi:hypothetical protein
MFVGVQYNPYIGNSNQVSANIVYGIVGVTFLGGFSWRIVLLDEPHMPRRLWFPPEEGNLNDEAYMLECAHAENMECAICGLYGRKHTEAQI